MYAFKGKFRRNGHLVIIVIVFRDRVYLCSPGYPGTLSVDQVGLKLADSPASAGQ